MKRIWWPVLTWMNYSRNKMRKSWTFINCRINQLMMLSFWLQIYKCTSENEINCLQQNACFKYVFVSQVCPCTYFSFSINSIHKWGSLLLFAHVWRCHWTYDSMRTQAQSSTCCTNYGCPHHTIRSRSGSCVVTTTAVAAAAVTPPHVPRACDYKML